MFTVKNSRDELFNLASQFRAAIEATPARDLPITLKTFPHGACGDAALLLAKFLGDQGCGRFDYMLGERDGHSHAWLQQGDLIVDIACDQFSDMPERVFVGRQSAWHAQFNAERESDANFELYDDATGLALERAYQIIVRHL